MVAPRLARRQSTREGLATPGRPGPRLAGRSMLPHRSQGDALMPAEISDEALDFLLARSGLALTPAQKAELKSVYAGIAGMAERVRKPRGPMAELAHVYNFTQDDL